MAIRCLRVRRTFSDLPPGPPFAREECERSCRDRRQQGALTARSVFPSGVRWKSSFDRGEAPSQLSLAGRATKAAPRLEAIDERLAHSRIWNDAAIRNALSWYLSVAENWRPANSASPRQSAPSSTPRRQANRALGGVRPPQPDLPCTLGGDPQGRVAAAGSGGTKPPRSARELSYRMLAHCNYLWNCRVDRLAGAKFGAAISTSRVSSHFHHMARSCSSRHAGLGDDLSTSCIMRLLPERRHLDRQG